MTANIDKVNPWKTVALILLGVLFGYLIGSYNLADFGQTEKEDKKVAKVVAEEKAPEEPPEIQIIDEDDDPYLGNSNASVVIVDFSDYLCPFCKKFHDTILPDLKADYIDTGKIKYVYRDFPLNIHPKAVNAAMAAQCAGDQNKYWEMNEVLFAKQGVWGSAPDVNEALIVFAKDLGLNVATFSSCLNDEKYLEEVEKDRDAAIGYGARGTPTLFVNGKIVRGVPRSYEAFKQLIEDELN